MADFSWRDYMAFASQTVYEAGRLTLGYFQTGIRPEFKEDDSPVTIADREAEALIRQRLEARFPTHEIFGEEFANKTASGASHRWYIDPIDGTKSFVRGVPIYATVLGLEVEGRIVAGAVYFPGTDELLAAAEGEGCWWNGRPARVSAETDFSRSVIAHIDTASFDRLGKGAAWERLQKASYYNAGWCDAYGYMLVATGRVELAIDPIINPYDIAPFAVILREAGGYLGDWAGNETIHNGECLATSRALLPTVLGLING